MNERYRCDRCKEIIFAKFELRCNKCGNRSEDGKESSTFYKVVEGFDWETWFIGFFVGNVFCGFCIWILASTR